MLRDGIQWITTGAKLRKPHIQFIQIRFEFVMREITFTPHTHSIPTTSLNLCSGTLKKFISISTRNVPVTWITLLWIWYLWFNKTIKLSACCLSLTTNSTYTDHCVTFLPSFFLSAFSRSTHTTWMEHKMWFNTNETISTTPNNRNFYTAKIFSSGPTAFYLCIFDSRSSSTTSSRKSLAWLAIECSVVVVTTKQTA